MGLTLSAFAQVPPPSPRQEMVRVDTGLGIATLPLWGGTGTTSESGKNSEDSSLTVFVPHPGTESGTAMIIAPGGAYANLRVTSKDGR